MATSKAAELKRLFAAADGALFELHRYIEREYKNEVWRTVYGTRLTLAQVNANIEMAAPHDAEIPPAAERPSHER